MLFENRVPGSQLLDRTYWAILIDCAMEPTVPPGISFQGKGWWALLRTDSKSSLSLKFAHYLVIVPGNKHINCSSPIQCFIAHRASAAFHLICQVSRTNAGAFKTSHPAEWVKNNRSRHPPIPSVIGTTRDTPMNRVSRTYTWVIKYVCDQDLKTAWETFSHAHPWVCTLPSFDPDRQTVSWVNIKTKAVNRPSS